MLKRILIVVVISFLANGYLFAKPPDIKDGGKIIRLLPKEAHIYYNLSYREGIDQIVALARSAKFEDAWIYVEKQRRWYDIGHEGDEKSVSIDLCVIENNPELVRGSDVVHIHIHPDYSEKNKVSFPSLEDLDTSADETQNFKNKYGALDIKHIAIDGFGLWVYNTKNTLLDEKFGKKLDNLFENFGCQTHSSKKMSRKERIERIITESHKLGIEITYIEYK